MEINKIIAMACIVITITSCGNKVESENAEIKTEMVNDTAATSTFKVWGNCDMCKETIETSLKAEGISKADWNVDTKILTVSYDATKITLDQIQKNVASVGYDNDKYKGDDKAYNELPDCCQYDRK